MDGLNLKSAVAGVVLIVVVVLLAVFNSSDLSEFEDEAIVIAALSEINSVQDYCDVSRGNNNDDFVTLESPVYIPHDDASIKTVLFDCRLPWEDEMTQMRIHLRYPLKTGVYSQQINMQTRLDVVDLIAQFLGVNLRRGAGMKEIPYEQIPSGSHIRSGQLYIHAYVPFYNDNYFGIKYETEILDVAANTSQSLLLSRNYRLNEYVVESNNVHVEWGDDFLLTAVVEPSADFYKTVREKIYLSFASETDFKDSDVREMARNTHFILTPDSLELGCEEYCDSGLLSGERWGGFHSIPYTEIEEHLIDDGPLRLVRQK